MSSTRFLFMSGLSVVAFAAAWAGFGDPEFFQPTPVARVSLAVPPSLDMMAFDNEETVIDAAFGPAMAQAVQLAQAEEPGAAAQPMNAEPPMPQPQPMTPVDKAGGVVPSDVAATVQGLRVGHSGDKSRVIIDLSAGTDFGYSVSKDGKSVTVVLTGAVWKAAAKGSTKTGGRITGYEYLPMDGGSKVVLSASEPVEILQVEPRPGEGQGFQLVIDMVDTKVAQVRRGGLSFWTATEAPKLAEAPAMIPEPAPAPPAPEAKVADASAQRGELAPVADYKKSSGRSDWSGFYAGVQTGYDWSKAKEKNGGASLGTRNVNGPEGGAFVGWGQQFGAWYVGAEMAGAYAAASGKRAVNGGKHEVSKSWNYSGALRVGASVFDDGLLYLKGGYQASSFKLKADHPNDAPAWSFSGSKVLYGPLVGAGFDYKLSDSWFVRTDASYVFYNSWKYADSAGGVGKVTPNDINLRIGVGYKF